MGLGAGGVVYCPTWRASERGELESVSWSCTWEFCWDLFLNVLLVHGSIYSWLYFESLILPKKEKMESAQWPIRQLATAWPGRLSVTKLCHSAAPSGPCSKAVLSCIWELRGFVCSLWWLFKPLGLLDFYLLCFWDRISLCSPDGPWICDLLASAFQSTVISSNIMPRKRSLALCFRQMSLKCWCKQVEGTLDL